jgi:hypothetical protein
MMHILSLSTFSQPIESFIDKDGMFSQSTNLIIITRFVFPRCILFAPWSFGSQEKTF